ncbi:MAG: BTAD domain-containing putative transcriptional regulator, partial [Acidimicrobiia bacterium]|nr:BTAD domain-containing putative transcriptional regulator [Acidimicrobiia bacterium]
MEIRVLGPIEALENGTRLGLGGPKQRTVLALLVANAGRPVSMGTLIEGGYGEDAPDRVHRSVHTFISNLRSELGEVIERQGDGYILTIDRQQIDALRFEDLVAEARREIAPADAASLLREGLEMWRGYPYADVEAHTLLGPEITRLNELRVAAIEARVDADLESGRDAELIAELESLTVEHPVHERFRAQQMLAFYRAGRQGDALRAYERTRAYLVDEMGLDPSPELRDLERRILEQDPELVLDLRPRVRAKTVMVADVADPAALADLPAGERHLVVSEQSAAIDHGVAIHGGEVFAERGSAVYASFDNAVGAAEAAAAIQQETVGQRLRLRLALASGDVEVATGDDIAGPPVTRAAALVAAAHGGQILLSADAHDTLTASGAAGLVVRSLGSHDIEGLADGELVYQLSVDGADDFPPLRVGQFPPPLPFAQRGIPGYELREVLGEGAHGVVHRAYQPSIGREVAVKIIRPRLANDATFIRRFEVDAQLIARLSHPHIAPLHDYWRQPDGAFLVTRLMAGGTLAGRLRNGPLSLKAASEVVLAIGSALDHAHRHGVIHGDVKASNVLFDDDGNAYLGDFGIVGVAGPESASITRDVTALARLADRCLADKRPVDQLLSEATTPGAFGGVGPFLDQWVAAVGSDQPSPLTEARNPYKGLRAFTELDAHDFFGREAEIERLVAAVAEQRLVAVVGPSGIGKSSVVRAGLIPALRSGEIDGSERWLVTDMLPGPYPFEELASALLRVATESSIELEDELRRDERGLVRAVRRYLPEGVTVVLLIDQFEELFTLVDDESEQAAFLELLTATVGDVRSNVRIVVTIRADFFDRPLRFGAFGELIRGATEPIAAPTVEALAEMVTGPVDGVGVACGAGLIDRITADVKDQPGALPLLEFSLTELFEHRASDLLSLDDYEASGGVLGALGRRAESIYTSLDSAEQDAARQVFLRLVSVSESGRDTRRRVRRGELERLGIDRIVLGQVLEAFGQHRLLTFDRDSATRGPTVEVAHEAILSEWPRLASWVQDQREDLLLHSRLAIAVRDWEEADRAQSYLLSGGRLHQHEAWTADSELALTGDELEFLDASKGRDLALRDQRRTRRRRVLGGYAAAAVVAAVLAVAAWAARNEAAGKADEALQSEASARLSEASLLARVEPELATLLTLAASGQRPVADEELAEVLHVTLQNWALLRREPAQRFGIPITVGMDRTGRYIAGINDTGEVKLWDDRIQLSPELVASWPYPGAADLASTDLPVVFPDPEGRRVAAYGDDGVLRVWEVGRSGSIHEIQLDAGPQGVPLFGQFNERWIAFEPGGDHVAVVTWLPDNFRLAEVRIIDLASESVVTLGTVFEPYWIDWTPDGSLAVAIRFIEAGVYRVDPFGIAEAFGEDGFPTDPETSLVLPSSNHVHEGALSADGTRVAYTALQGFVLADADGRLRLGPIEVDGPAISVEFSPDSSKVAVGSEGGTVYVWDVERGELIAELGGGHDVAVPLIAWSDDGSSLRSIDGRGASAVWDVGGKPGGEL